VILVVVLSTLTGTSTRLLAVRQENVEGRASVTIIAIGPMEDSSVQRDGAQIVVYLPAVAPEGFSLPEPRPPVEGMNLIKAGAGLELRIRVPDLPYELKRDGSRLELLLGTPAPASQGADVRTLYRQLFPAVSGDQEAGGAQTPLAMDQPPSKEGLFVGSISVRPTVTGSYVDANATVLNTPAPVPEQYFETRPRVDAETPIGDGQLRAGYEARIRSFASLPVLQTTSQGVDATLQLPVTARAEVQVTEHFFAGTLETSEVDPGAEYFYDLAYFRRNELQGSVRIEAGSRMFVEVGGSLNDVNLDQPSNFFSYREYEGRASLGVEIGPRLRAALDYTYTDIPFTAERPIAMSHGQSLGLSLRGDLTPLTKVDLAAGYRDEKDPLAGPGGQQYQGFVYSASVTREFTPGASASFSGVRTTLPSAFESNGLYVTNALQLSVGLQAPLSVAFRGGLGYRWNDYQVVTLGSTLPRYDTIVGYSVGIGRPLSRWAFLRVDYSRQRRDSNVAGLSTATHVFSAQIGVGYLGGSPQP
jgi:hypothetical protein